MADTDGMAQTDDGLNADPLTNAVDVRAPRSEERPTPTSVIVTCECERGPREVVKHTDDAGVSWWTLADRCSDCLAALPDGELASVTREEWEMWRHVSWAAAVKMYAARNGMDARANITRIKTAFSNFAASVAADSDRSKNDE